MPNLRQVEIFLKEQRMAATVFGRLVANDPRLVLDMRNGRVPRYNMQRRMAAFMRGQGKVGSVCLRNAT